MTQEIKPAYVTREQANQLKEKEFDIPTYAYYYGLNFYTGEYKNHSQTTIGDTEMHKRLIGYISAPEQHQVVEWLRVNHGIWIPINPKREKINGVNEMWYDAEVWKLEPDEIKGYGWNELAETFETPQEAYSAAFNYVLNNLI
jgi:hypothetical protein